ncbi:MAG: helix-turn-helix transcriptional regulator [Actinomycetota bacterium]|nr:helix-turn-helix transcriptional regulator [Actinomycetota bacterium]
MSPTRKLGIRRTMTPNQVVAYNVVKARAIRGWTQEEAAEALAPYLGAKLSGPSFSALERSAVKVERIKQFSADDLLALSRGFDLPIGYFFTPPPPAADAGLFAPDAGVKGLDPIVLLDAILGTPDNLDHWADELLAYSASHAPMPRSKREKASVSPSDLADRLSPLIDMRAKALLRNALGDPDNASDLLERLAEALRAMNDTTPPEAADKPARAGTKDQTASAGTASRKKTRRTR